MMTKVQFEKVYKRFKDSDLTVRDFCNNEGFIIGKTS
jgi:hypothetical protein